ncbi:hypothetical protein Ancab_016256, partial [Ancistrocladus abbreviatus]
MLHANSKRESTSDFVYDSFVPIAVYHKSINIIFVTSKSIDKENEKLSLLKISKRKLAFDCDSVFYGRSSFSNEANTRRPVRFDDLWMIKKKLIEGDLGSLCRLLMSKKGVRGSILLEMSSK